MTTANHLNFSNVNSNIGLQAEGTKKLQEENLEIASVFSALMSNQVELTNHIVSDADETISVSKTGNVSDVTESYDRYQYKDNKIDVAQEKTVEETMEESSEEIQEFEEQAIEAICEEYGVDKETVLQVLEELGLTVFDLLNPQNLVLFTMELTGVTSVEEVLLDEHFLSVMDAFDSMKNDFMEELDITPQELDELVSKLNLMNQPQEEVLDVPMEQEQLAESDTVLEVSDEIVIDSEATTQIQEETSEESVTVKESVEQGDVQEMDEEMNRDVSVEKESESSEEKQDGEQFTQKRESTPFSDMNSGETVVTHSNSTTKDVSFEVPNMSNQAYTSADSVQIMEQIVKQMVENVKVYTQEVTTTMEMQLNPENLGKVILHISSEEGVVNAQFAATTEIAKEALEAQVATLRENLTQAGVKVDAIEVTIASHEFEQNLEQNQSRQEDEAVRTANQSEKRRNLHVDSLDELAGVMTEEETLVAQIMKDNGNSVDLTA